MVIDANRTHPAPRESPGSAIARLLSSERRGAALAESSHGLGGEPWNQARALVEQAHPRMVDRQPRAQPCPSVPIELGDRLSCVLLVAVAQVRALEEQL